MSTLHESYRMPADGAHHMSRERALQQYRHRMAWRVSARRYLIASVLCAAFSAVYEHFSHGVWSLWMVGLCAWPLLLGVLPALMCGIMRVRVHKVARDLWACAVMTFTMGSCLRGVLEIYGTTSPLVTPYIPVGLGLLVLAVFAQVIGGARARKA